MAVEPNTLRVVKGGQGRHTWLLYQFCQLSIRRGWKEKGDAAFEVRNIRVIPFATFIPRDTRADVVPNPHPPHSTAPPGILFRELASQIRGIESHPAKGSLIQPVYRLRPPFSSFFSALSLSSFVWPTLFTSRPFLG